MSTIRFLVLAALVLGMLLPPAAHAAATVTTLDGPGADVRLAGGIDIAPDGTGALVYLKAVGGSDHVFVSRLSGGVWSAPQDLSPTLNVSVPPRTRAAGSSSRTATARRRGT